MDITQFVVFWVVFLVSAVAFWKVSGAFMDYLNKVQFSLDHNRGIALGFVAWAAFLVLGLIGYLSHVLLGWHWPDWTLIAVIIMVMVELLIVAVRGDIKRNRAH